jgi:hypothetical protein
MNEYFVIGKHVVTKGIVNRRDNFVTELGIGKLGGCRKTCHWLAIILLCANIIVEINSKLMARKVFFCMFPLLGDEYE